MLLVLESVVWHKIGVVLGYGSVWMFHLTLDFLSVGCGVVYLCIFFFFLRTRRPPRSTHCISSAASDVYKRQPHIIILPTHAFVCYETNPNSPGSLSCLETTMTGSSTFEDAVAYGNQEYQTEIDNGDFKSGASQDLSVAKLRKLGILPMQQTGIYKKYGVPESPATIFLDPPGKNTFSAPDENIRYARRDNQRVSGTGTPYGQHRY
eukprot:TRINITY_DN21837_c0_g1_i1.p1 TRINITY_DN21837_c0_g1~~TRINITY_DN21837_c0_g1_i1.p1  ORF type:complete len:207 (+),score=-7.62 TRINITY_DN21837_c0_g1_i1:2-622(+)